MITVNAVGEACPIPVVKTRKAVSSLQGKSGEVETLVDNEIAVQNLLKMAEQKHYAASSEQLENGTYRVVMRIPADAGIAAGAEVCEDAAAGGAEGSGTVSAGTEPEEYCDCAAGRKETVVVISSDQMGSGSPELGAQLMKAFIFALGQQEELPDTILCYNGGVRMTTENEAAVEDLRKMAEQGTRILSCGTCLNFYGLTEKLQVGEITNMYEIVEIQSKAGKIIRP